MLQERYFTAPIEIFDQERQVALLPAALVSSTCIFRVLRDSAFARRAFLQRKLFLVRMRDGGLLHGRLIREVGRDGVHFHLRLLQTADQPESLMGLYLSHQGFRNPWKRKLPRIPVAPLHRELEVPVKAFLPRVARETEGVVLNFSCHGLYFEFKCSGLSLTEQVGQILTLRLLTSSRLSLSGIRARVVNLYDEAAERGKFVRGIGVRFVSMRREVRRKYDDMILDVCRNQKIPS